MLLSKSFLITNSRVQSASMNKISTKKQGNITIYAFIDSQNLNLGVRSLGWRIDYRRFRLYLTNKYGVEKAFMFLGFIPGNEDLYKRLQKAGFILVFKDISQYFKRGRLHIKGNVDAELVLHAAAIEYENYDKAIIVTGDGDFACLIDFLLQREKLAYVLAPSSKYSKILKKFRGSVIEIGDSIQTFGFKEKSARRHGRSKP